MHRGISAAIMDLDNSPLIKYIVNLHVVSLWIGSIAIFICRTTGLPVPKLFLKGEKSKPLLAALEIQKQVLKQKQFLKPCLIALGA